MKLSWGFLGLLVAVGTGSITGGSNAAAATRATTARRVHKLSSLRPAVMPNKKKVLPGKRGFMGIRVSRQGRVGANPTPYPHPNPVAALQGTWRRLRSQVSAVLRSAARVGASPKPYPHPVPVAFLRRAWQEASRTMTHFLSSVGRLGANPTPHP